MNLNELRDRAYKNAVAHGWHEKELSDEHCLWLVITELAEATEADRKGKHADVDTFKYVIEDDLRERHLAGKEYEASFIDNFREFIKDSVEDELADACIRLLDLAGSRGIGFEKANYIINEMKETESDNTFTGYMYYCTSLLKRENYDIEMKVNTALAFIILLCKQILKVDIYWHIEQKMEYNETRPYKHGKQY